MNLHPDIILLFSGGLDSILAARILEEQGLAVRCLHLISPFFGTPENLPFWYESYGLEVVTRDVSESFVSMLQAGPAHGFGKVLNPCVDCKILFLRTARQYMEEVGAKALATGEVLGQRPMSQRRDALQITVREAGVSDVLLRPLSALHLPPSVVEQQGIVDRSRLLGLWGRGRSEQLRLARAWGISPIPTPGGGCRLAERENARRYWSVLRRLPSPAVEDFYLANLGRQFWHRRDDRYFWLCVGRNQTDNGRLERAAGDEDIVLSLPDLPGPLALARYALHWPEEILLAAARMTLSYAPKAVASGGPVQLCMRGRSAYREMALLPERRADLWSEAPWEEVRSQIRAAASESASGK
jgi:tRNA-specific 2-thiouridylase